MRGLIAACAAVSLLALVLATTASATPAPDPTKACKKGYVLAATGSDPSSFASTYDSDGNGWVCYDPVANDFRDDKGQFAPQEANGPAVDENGDGFVCVDASRGAVVDDTLDPSSPTGFTCPSGFAPLPATVV